MDVGTVASGDGDSDLAVFVERLAAAGSDRPTSSASAQIRRAIAAGDSPAGLRMLAEALAASVGELPPQPRRPAEDTASVVAAMGGNAHVVLSDVDAVAVAGTVAALLADGRRVVVTAAVANELAAVRAALPSDVVDRVVEQLPGLTAADLRELRRLLATSTAARQARVSQQLPSAAALPAMDEVAWLCARAVRPAGPGHGADLVPTLLADLEPDRREAVISVARCVSNSLGALRPRAEREWQWSLLSDLTFDRHRPAFQRMLEDTAQAITALDGARGTPQVTVGGPLPPDAIRVLRRYREFLSSGGRSRPYFRPAIRREVEPVLRLVRYDGRPPDTEDEISRVIEHLELGERLAAVDVACAEVGISAPRDEQELIGLTEGLVQVGAAARSVGALRHDVLFIAPNSPLSVPDAETAAQIAQAILDYAEHGSAEEAGRSLDLMADSLAAGCPAAVMSPEHERLVAALRDHDAPAYAAAMESLGAARRELRDENRRIELLRGLAQGSPGLAQAWAASAQRHPAALGLACFLSTDALLSALPASDHVDVVVVLGSTRMGVERLLLTAVAPRMIAAMGPGEQPGSAPSLLGVLQRAGALVIRGQSAAGGRVVHLSGLQRAGTGPLVERPGPAAVGQAGA